MNAKKGFTLIEIMIVVAIIAILAAIAIPNFIAYRETAQLNSCKANCQTIKNAAEAWQVKNNSTAIPTMAQLTDNSNGTPYLKTEPKCPADKTKAYTVGTDSSTKEITVTCGGQSKSHNVSGQTYED